MEWRNMNNLLKPRAKEKMFMLVDGEKTINGKRYYMLVGSDTIPGTGEFVSYFRKAEDGIYEGVGEKEKMVFPFPPTVGKAWSIGDGERHIVSNETLYVFDKKYKDCLKITDKVPDEETRYYAPNIGLVKWTFTLSPSMILEFTLNEYKP